MAFDDILDVTADVLYTMASDRILQTAKNPKSITRISKTMQSQSFVSTEEGCCIEPCAPFTLYSSSTAVSKTKRIGPALEIGSFVRPDTRGGTRWGARRGARVVLSINRC